MTAEERLAIVETEMKALKEAVSAMAADVAELKRLSTLGRGALMMLARIGLYIGAALAAFDWFIAHMKMWLK